MILVQKLALQASHIHPGRAFPFAGLAFQTQIEDRQQLLVAEPGRLQTAGKGQTQGVGAAARAVDFVARGHIGRAHGACKRLAACAYAAALFGCLQQPAEIGKIECGGVVRLLAIYLRASAVGFKAARL